MISGLHSAKNAELVKLLRQEADRLTESTGTIFMTRKESQRRLRTILLLDKAAQAILDCESCQQPS